MLKAPLVVGYKGEIGRFILSCLLEDMPRANDILCVDVNNSEEDVHERLQRTDSIFLCVPLQSTADWLIKYRKAIGKTMVVEQSSLKGFLYTDPAFAEINLLSMHLLFRPSATPVEDRRALIFSDRRARGEVDALASEFTRMFRTPFEVLRAPKGNTHELHDRLMATNQALVHKVVLCLAETLSDPKTRTYVGQRICELADRIRSGDKVLYRMIQENRYAPEAIDSFVRDLS